MTNTEKNWDFDKWSENYDETVLDENWIHDGYTEIIKKVAGIILKYSSSKNIKLLDIGAGTGNLISKLQTQENIEFWAVEPSRGMREKLSEKCGNIKIIDGMLPEMQEIPEKFDVIVSTYAIHHVKHENTEHMVDNICKHANKNCLALFADVMFESKEDYQNHIAELKRKNITERAYDLDDEYFQYVDVLTDVFKKHGFMVKDDRQNFYTHIFRALR
ncbi:MAG: class I SAM-dependent methyltransferase [Caldisericia bacterium]